MITYTENKALQNAPYFAWVKVKDSRGVWSAWSSSVMFSVDALTSSIIDYTYDQTGNRTKKNDSGVTTTYNYNNMNQLISMVENGATINFFYDPNGNQIRKEKGLEKWYYTYDFENRLTKVEYFDGTQTTVLGQYFYDGDGKRIKKVESSQTTIYIYLGWNIIYEKEFSTMAETKYIYKADCGCHVGKVVGGTTYFLHVDHLGSLRQETDSSGNIVWASPAIYEPFGELRGGGPANNEEGHLYTGKLKDTSTGLYYYGARYYDAKVGRFITKDLWAGDISMPQTLNDYIYVLNNPLKLVDYSGNIPSCPLCKPGENNIGPPLPVSHYLWGLVIAAGITLLIVACAYGLPALAFHGLRLFISWVATKISTAYANITAWAIRSRDSIYAFIRFKVTSGTNAIRSILDRAILVYDNLKNTDPSVVANDFIQWVEANEPLVKQKMLDFIRENMSEIGAHGTYEFLSFIWEKINGEYEVTGCLVKEWTLTGSGWAWVEKCIGPGCNKGPPLE